MKPRPRVLLATRNAGKLREVQGRLDQLGLEIETLDAYPHAPEVEETGATFQQNAHLKASQTALATGRWVIAEDSGLCVDALGGAPGVHSARYAGAHGDDEANNCKLLEALAGRNQRNAWYECVMALSRPDGEIVATVRGRCTGRIGNTPRGAGGFGYDPLFVCEALAPRTMAELSPDEKHGISHRGAALRALAPLLAAHLHEIDV